MEGMNDEEDGNKMEKLFPWEMTSGKSHRMKIATCLISLYKVYILYYIYKYIYNIIYRNIDILSFFSYFRFLLHIYGVFWLQWNIDIESVMIEIFTKYSFILQGGEPRKGERWKTKLNTLKK